LWCRLELVGIAVDSTVVGVRGRCILVGSTVVEGRGHCIEVVEVDSIVAVGLEHVEQLGLVLERDHFRRSLGRSNVHHMNHHRNRFLHCFLAGMKAVVVPDIGVGVCIVAEELGQLGLEEPLANDRQMLGN
jgi:hypothetical protein